MTSAALLVAAEIVGLPLPPVHSLRRFGFFDLGVYRQAAGIVAHGGALYGAAFAHHLGFTYPPAAALAFLALRLVSLRVDAALVTLLNLALVMVIAHAALRLRVRSVQATNHRRLPGTAWLCAAAALWIEPVTTAIGYGQIDLLIAALVVVDLARDRRARSAGMLIGLAAGLKLTPLIFVPYLWLSGRRRAVRGALLGFVATIAVSFVMLPGDSCAFWGGAIFDVSRVTGRRHSGGGPADQSLHGLLMRIDPGLPHGELVWLLSCAVVGATGLALAVRSARRDDAARGFALTAVTDLLVSPISWTHHWTIAVPGLLLGAEAARRRSMRVLLRVATATLAVGASAIWLVIDAHPTGEHLGWGGFLLGDLYVFVGLGAIAVALVAELATVRADRRTAGSAGQAIATHVSGDGRRDLGDRDTKAPASAMSRRDADATSGARPAAWVRASRGASPCRDFR